MAYPGRFLIDEGMSPRIRDALREAGFDAVHARDVGMHGQPDLDMLNRAVAEGRVVVTQDIDFSDIVHRENLPGPSIILFRDRIGRPSRQARLLLNALPAIREQLAAGVVVVIDDVAVRVRALRPQGDSP
jgi:predicted nuclease of predicted toxin-antitoxin system